MTVLTIYNYYASNGGVINGAIFLVAVITLYIGIGKLIQYSKFRKVIKRIHSEDKYISIAGMTICKRECTVIKKPKFYNNAFREKLLEVVPQIERGLDSMVALIQAAPLLGLLGTVVGMIKTFSLITTYGTANPVILTEGITVSLLTTQAGLLVAFPCMLFHNYVKNTKEILIHELIATAEKDVGALVGEELKNNV